MWGMLCILLTMYESLSQVDNHDLGKISNQEIVKRIKDGSVVTITVLRGGGMEANSVPHLEEEHVYDEILYADLSQPTLSQQDENFPFMAQRDTSPPAVRKNSFPLYDSRPPRMVRPVSPGPTYLYRATTTVQASSPQSQKAKQSGEKSSKDSGLSSGSSGSPNPFVRPPAKAVDPKSHRNMVRLYPGSSQDLDRGVTARHSYRTEREMLRNFLKTQKRTVHTQQVEPTTSSRRKNCRIEGDYEVEVSIDYNPIIM